MCALLIVTLYPIDRRWMFCLSWPLSVMMQRHHWQNKFQNVWFLWQFADLYSIQSDLKTRAQGCNSKRSNHPWFLRPTSIYSPFFSTAEDTHVRTLTNWRSFTQSQILSSKPCVETSRVPTDQWFLWLLSPWWLTRKKVTHFLVR